MPDYYIEADYPNTYLSSNVGNTMPFIWDETTQTGEDAGVLIFDTGVSLTFINAVAGSTIGPYDDSGFDTGYLFVAWDASAALGSVTISLVFKTGPAPGGSDIHTYSATNTVGEGGDATSAILLLPTAVLLPPLGSLRATFTHNGTPTTFAIYAELSLDYAETGRKWWAGVAGWTA